MTLRLRLFLLIAVLVAAFAVSLSVLRSLQQSELEQITANTKMSKTRIMELWMDLHGDPLQQFSRDYSNWTDMANFVKSGDKTWARVNIDESLANFRACAAWVYDPDGRLVHAAFNPEEAGSPAYEPAQREALLLYARKLRFTHFFALCQRGLIEVHGSPVQLSEDTPRTGPPLGWFYVARLWDNSVLNSLTEFVGSKAVLVLPDSPASRPNAENIISISFPLVDIDLKPLRMLHVEVKPIEISTKLHYESLRTLVYLSFGVTTLLLLFLCLRIWVLSPLERIGHSLAKSDPAPLEGLLSQKNELGRMARLVDDSFSHRSRLEREIDDRKRAEAALRFSEAVLRENMEARATLGRNLHDSVIQSLYAAGMGLGGVKAVMGRNPSEAEARLEQTRNQLNEIIRDVRNFITGLEPEALRKQSFAQAFQGLVEQMKSLGAFQATVDVDDNLAEQLSLVQRAHALQIAREALSNALRHGQASRITLSLREKEGRIALEISDNGCGFDTNNLGHTGKGLANLSERAQDLGADIKLESIPGKGTFVRLLLPRSLP